MKFVSLIVSLKKKKGWCRGRCPKKKRHMFPLFSGLTLFLAFAVHLAALGRDLRPACLCGSFSGLSKPGGQSLTHRKSVRTIEVALGRSASWQVDLHRQVHQVVVVVGDVEEPAVQWGTKVYEAVRPYSS